MRRYTALLVLLAIVSASCNRTAPAEDGRKTVALVLKTLNHPFFVDMRRGAQEAADRLGVTLQVQAAEGQKPALIVGNYPQLLRDEGPTGPIGSTTSAPLPAS